MRSRVAALTVFLCASTALAADCNISSVGITPLDDLAIGIYKNQIGGLYPGGSRTRPALHDAAGRARASAIQPIDGKIVLISIGMSNTTQEFSSFVPLAMNHPQRNPALQVIDTAQGGVDANAMANPNHAYWTNVMTRLAQNSATAAQVRAVWLKQAIAGPNQAFPAEVLELKTALRAIVQNLHALFPNLELCYLSSRIYAGYATTTLNPEPHAYETGFAVKWLIEDQINGDPSLNYDPQNGPVEAPWLAWGPYLWADGMIPRSDGLIWRCEDLNEDGTHPSNLGRAKVANLLLSFFTTDTTTTPWFLAAPTSALPRVRFGFQFRQQPTAAAQSGLILDVDREMQITIEFVNLRGQRILTRPKQLFVQGPHEIHWAADARAVDAPSGVYFVRAHGNGITSSARLVLVK